MKVLLDVLCISNNSRMLGHTTDKFNVKLEMEETEFIFKYHILRFYKGNPFNN